MSPRVSNSATGPRGICSKTHGHVLSQSGVVLKSSPLAENGPAPSSRARSVSALTATRLCEALSGNVLRSRFLPTGWPKKQSACGLCTSLTRYPVYGAPPLAGRPVHAAFRASRPTPEGWGLQGSALEHCSSENGVAHADPNHFLPLSSRTIPLADARGSVVLQVLSGCVLRPTMRMLGASRSPDQRLGGRHLTLFTSHTRYARLGSS